MACLMMLMKESGRVIFLDSFFAEPVDAALKGVLGCAPRVLGLPRVLLLQAFRYITRMRNLNASMRHAKGMGAAGDHSQKKDQAR